MHIQHVFGSLYHEAHYLSLLEKNSVRVKRAALGNNLNDSQEVKKNCSFPDHYTHTLLADSSDCFLPTTFSPEELPIAPPSPLGEIVLRKKW